MLKFERDLQRDIQRLRDQLDETQRELRLSPENVQKVVEVGLQLAGQPALIPTDVERKGDDGEPARSRPSVSRPSRAVGRFAPKGLAHPHTQEIRPIVFDHNLAQGRDDVVLVHLNHRLVQMCLRLLAGRGLVHRGQEAAEPDHGPPGSRHGAA